MLARSWGILRLQEQEGRSGVQENYEPVLMLAVT
jgi:hypothetical protein